MTNKEFYESHTHTHTRFLNKNRDSHLLYCQFNLMVDIRRQVGSQLNCVSSDVWLAIRDKSREKYIIVYVEKQTNKQQFLHCH